MPDAEIDQLRNQPYKHKNNDIWYKICASSPRFESTKDIIHLAVSLLVRDQNKYSVESLIGNIQEVDCSNRLCMSHETARIFQKKGLITYVFTRIEEKDPESNIS